jgi:pimeloyl-ACP methyl ester carboxylesterase
MTATATNEVTYRTISVWQNRIDLRVQVKGHGAPILYLHPAGGMSWDPFLDDLARNHTVYAPEFPGTTPGNDAAIHQVDDVFDIVLIYEEAIHALGLRGAVVVGQSFGGMVAAELASAFPTLFSKVVLLDPAGLWLAEQPATMEFMACPPERLPSLLFHDPTCPGAQAMFAPPPDPELAIDIAVGLVWAIGCTAKFLWPIPDRGLHKRLHRMTAPTLIMWGEQDALFPLAYGHEFARRIAGSKLVTVPNCGHIPQIEQSAVTIDTVRTFLDG